MMQIDVYEIAQRLSQKHGVPPEQIIQEMEQALALTFAQPMNDKAQQLFGRQPPSLARLIATLADSCG